MLIFAEGGKPENPEKNPRSEDENKSSNLPFFSTSLSWDIVNKVLIPLVERAQSQQIRSKRESAVPIIFYFYISRHRYSALSQENGWVSSNLISFPFFKSCSMFLLLHATCVFTVAFFCYRHVQFKMHECLTFVILVRVQNVFKEKGFKA